MSGNKLFVPRNFTLYVHIRTVTTCAWFIKFKYSSSNSVVIKGLSYRSVQSIDIIVNTMLKILDIDNNADNNIDRLNLFL